MHALSCHTSGRGPPRGERGATEESRGLRDVAVPCDVGGARTSPLSMSSVQPPPECEAQVGP
eukprot:2222535-Alexandrium_andersonii.AAC.1